MNEFGAAVLSEFVVEVGASSRDLRLRESVVVKAELPRLRLDGMSTLEEWLADPDGGPALRAAVGYDDQGRPNGILADEELMRIVGNFPLSAMASFGLGITPEVVEVLSARG